MPPPEGSQTLRGFLRARHSYSATGYKNSEYVYISSINIAAAMWYTRNSQEESGGRSETAQQGEHVENIHDALLLNESVQSIGARGEGNGRAV